MLNATSDKKPAAGAPLSGLLIGCSDSTSAASSGIVSSGILFHDNMANLAESADMNFLSVIHYAVERCQVESIIVCGHHGCRSVRGAIEESLPALVASWLHPIVELANKYKDVLDGISEESCRLNALCELNVIEQVAAVGRIPVVELGRQTRRGLTVRGIVHDEANSLVEECAFLIRAEESISDRKDEAIIAFRRRWGITSNGDQHEYA